MLQYILGSVKNLFNPAVSLLVKIDNRSIIKHKAKVYSFVQVTNSTIGDYSYVGRDSRIIYADVGKFCSIANGTIIGMGTHTLDNISTSPIFTEKKNGTKHSWVKTSAVNPYKRVIIGNDVWIGLRVMVMGGVKIGDGAVIGAGSIVTKDIPPYAIVAGVPAKIIRFRFPQEQIDSLLQNPWWELPDIILKERIDLFQSRDNISNTINELCHILDNKC
jgi:acetyltransferase-like isoleucine patch superfamily enzyme